MTRFSTTTKKVDFPAGVPKSRFPQKGLKKGRKVLMAGHASKLGVVSVGSPCSRLGLVFGRTVSSMNTSSVDGGLSPYELVYMAPSDSPALALTETGPMDTFIRDSNGPSFWTNQNLVLKIFPV